MNNSDSPAMPQSGTESQYGDLNSSNDWGGSGITKREHFAGLAPDNIPKWFFNVWIKELGGDNEEYHWHRDRCLDMCAEGGFTEKGGVALFFAWRGYYADQLLAELDK